MSTARLRTWVTLTWLGLMISYGSCHRGRYGYYPSPNVNITVTLKSGQELTLPFSESGFHRMLTDCLCNTKVGTCYYYSKFVDWHNERYSELVPGDQRTTWQIQVGYYYPFNDMHKTPVVYELWMKWHSFGHPASCLDNSCSNVLDQPVTCQSGVERVYLGANRWLEVYDYARVCNQCNNGVKVCEDDDADCPGMFSNNSITMGEISDIMDNATVSAQDESSSDQAPVIVGIVIAVLIVLILLALFAAILWRCKKSKQAKANKEASPTFAVFNPGVFAGENAQNDAAESLDQQSVSTLGLPPPYDEVVSAQNAGNQQGFANHTFAV